MFFSPVGDTALLTAGLAGQVQGAGAVVSQLQGEQGQVSGVVRVETNRQEFRFNYLAEGAHLICEMLMKLSWSPSFTTSKSSDMLKTHWASMESEDVRLY